MRILFYSIVTLSLFFFDLNASVSQGKEIYTKACLTCHPYAKNMAGKKTSNTWKRIFKHQGSTNELATLHLSTEKAKASWTYFKEDGYKKETRHLRDFMLKYSSDRGKHNSCY